ncbi:hypothetical protein ACLOJK_037617 [Asimina triloba]
MNSTRPLCCRSICKRHPLSVADRADRLEVFSSPDLSCLAHSEASPVAESSPDLGTPLLRLSSSSTYVSVARSRRICEVYLPKALAMCLSLRSLHHPSLRHRIWLPPKLNLYLESPKPSRDLVDSKSGHDIHERWDCEMITTIISGLPAGERVQQTAATKKTFGSKQDYCWLCHVKPFITSCLINERDFVPLVVAVE